MIVEGKLCILNCKKHKRYKGKKQPQILCLGCWAVYLMEHKDEPVTNLVLALVMASIVGSTNENEKDTRRKSRHR